MGGSAPQQHGTSPCVGGVRGDKGFSEAPPPSPERALAYLGFVPSLGLSGVAVPALDSDGERLATDRVHSDLAVNEWERGRLAVWPMLSIKRSAKPAKYQCRLGLGPEDILPMPFNVGRFGAQPSIRYRAEWLSIKAH